MKTYTDENFEAQAKNKAKSYSEVDDPLIFEGIEINEDGKKEAYFYDSRCVYYVDESLRFHYACAR